jgi:hypothetical protein
VQQALKKQIISVFEPMYLEILNDNMVGYANISARDMLDHLFETYGNIIAVDLEINFEHMRRAWDPQQPVESLFKQIQDCADYCESGGVLIWHPQQINAEDQMSEATIGALANLTTAAAADRGLVAALIQANAHLVKQIEDDSNELRELKALLKKERTENRGHHSFKPSPRKYFWTHGYKVGSTYTSLTCKLPKQSQKKEATRVDNMGGRQANKESYSGATTLNNNSTFEVCRTPLLNSRSPSRARTHTHRHARALWEPLRLELPCRMHML